MTSIFPLTKRFFFNLISEQFWASVKGLGFYESTKSLTAFDSLTKRPELT